MPWRQELSDIPRFCVYVPGLQDHSVFEHRYTPFSAATFSYRGCDSRELQFLTCLYAQITGKDSLREICDGLLTNQARLYYLGMEPVAKSTLADAMNRRAPAVFSDLFNEFLDRCTKLAPGHGFRFHNPLYALDSTTIPLYLSVYDWAYYRKHKGAVKLHPQLDLSGCLPCYMVMSSGKMADIRFYG